MTRAVSVQKRIHSQIVSFRASRGAGTSFQSLVALPTPCRWREENRRIAASSQTDARAPKATQMGQPGRPLSDHSGKRGQKNPQVQKHAATNATQAATNTKNRIASFVAESSIGRTQGKLSCVHTTKRKFRPLQNCRDAFRRGMTKLSLRQIGHGLQGIAGRKNARPRLRASENETSARPSVGSAASLSRPTPSWSRSFKSYSSDSPPITGEWSPSKHRKDDDLWPQGVVGGLTHNQHPAALTPESKR
jgi:hypothetical protein